MTTLITDDFEHSHQYGDPHLSYIVYGQKGWTDSLDRATIDVLLRVGAIKLDRTVSGPGWQTNLYRSLKGALPDEEVSNRS